MPFTVKKYQTRKKFNAYNRCVKEVGEKDSVNPYAVCRSSVYGKKPSIIVYVDKEGNKRWKHSDKKGAIYGK